MSGIVAIIRDEKTVTRTDVSMMILDLVVDEEGGINCPTDVTRKTLKVVMAKRDSSDPTVLSVPSKAQSVEDNHRNCCLQ